MIPAQLPLNEESRLKALHALGILDTLPEAEFDNITALASEICKIPISLITLIDDKRQWFKSSKGLEVEPTTRELSFCSHTILHPYEVFTVKDSRLDERFHDNPFVTGDPHVVFYSGVPLVDDEGHALGSLCVLDNTPRDLSEGQINALKALANQVVKLFELRKAHLLLTHAQEHLVDKNLELETFAVRAAHDLRSPLHQINQIVDVLSDGLTHGLAKEEVETMLSFLHKSSHHLDELVSGILNHTLSNVNQESERSTTSFSEFINTFINIINQDKNVDITYSSDIDIIKIDKISIEQILLNLITNAIKYSDKDKTIIHVNLIDTTDHYQFSVKDNGKGIDEKNQKAIFDLFTVLNSSDRFGKKSTGIGLATVKKMVNLLGGEIWLESELNKGSTFYFTVRK